MKSLLILLVGLLLGAAGVIGAYVYFSSHQAGDEILTLTFTEEDLQEKLGRKFPKEEKLLGLITVVIEEPRVDLMGLDNRIRLQAKAVVTIPFVSVEELDLTVSSSVRYNAEDHTVRISDYEVENLKTDRLPKKYETLVRSAITAAARELFDDEVVHTIKDQDFEDKVGRLLIQKITVKNGVLEVSLGI